MASRVRSAYHRSFRALHENLFDHDPGVQGQPLRVGATGCAVAPARAGAPSGCQPGTNSSPDWLGSGGTRVLVAANKPASWKRSIERARRIRITGAGF